MSERLTGRKLSLEHRAALSRAALGKKYALGHKHSIETREKMSASRLGNKRPVEHCRAISEGRKLRFQDPEYREKYAKNLEKARAAQRAKPGWWERNAEHCRQMAMTQPRYRRIEYMDRLGRLHCFKSTWERTFAETLDQAEMMWEYEPHWLLLSDGRKYLPDFAIYQASASGNPIIIEYIEVKGWRGLGDLTRAEQAIRDGHNIRLIVGRDAFKEALAAMV